MSKNAMAGTVALAGNKKAKSCSSVVPEKKHFMKVQREQLE